MVLVIMQCVVCGCVFEVEREILFSTCFFGQLLAAD